MPTARAAMLGGLRLGLMVLASFALLLLAAEAARADDPLVADSPTVPAVEPVVQAAAEPVAEAAVEPVAEVQDVAEDVVEAAAPVADKDDLHAVRGAVADTVEAVADTVEAIEAVSDVAPPEVNEEPQPPATALIATLDLRTRRLLAVHRDSAVPSGASAPQTQDVSAARANAPAATTADPADLLHPVPATLLPRHPAPPISATSAEPDSAGAKPLAVPASTVVLPAWGIRLATGPAAVHPRSRIAGPPAPPG